MDVDLKMRNYERIFILTHTTRILQHFIFLFIFINVLKAQPTSPIIEIKKSEIIEYSQLDRWAAHPDKKDFSDSISKSIKNERNEISADVFVH
jgi:hypothetical protein